MRCDNCGKDLTNRAIRILPDFYGGRNYYVCDSQCEDILTGSRDGLYEEQEQMEREMYKEIYGKQFI